MTNLPPSTQLLLVVALVQFWLLPLSAWWMQRKWQDRNARLWFSGTAFYALAVTAFAFSQPGGNLWAFAGMWFFSILSLVLMTEALHQEFVQRPVLKLAYRIAAICSLPTIILCFLISKNEYLARACYLTLMSVLEIRLIALAFKIKRLRGSRALDIVIFSFGVFVLSNLARVLDWAFSGSLPPLLNFDWLTNLAVVINLVGVVFYSFGYWGFSLEKSKRLAEDSAQQALKATTLANNAKYREAVAREREALLSRMVELGRVAQAGAVSASIAHEINQPLASIRLNLDAALAELGSEPGETRLKRLLDRANAENMRAARIIERIRSLFQTRAQHSERLVVDHIIERVLTLLHQDKRSAGVTIQTIFAAPDPIQIGEGELEHVMINLISNALDSVNATDREFKIVKISTSQDENLTRIQVTDNGPGVSPEVGESLFDIAISTKPKGMGLGLWLARYITERQGGYLKLAEQQPVQGASFLIELPSVSAVAGDIGQTPAGPPGWG